MFPSDGLRSAQLFTWRPGSLALSRGLPRQRSFTLRLSARQKACSCKRWNFSRLLEFAAVLLEGNVDKKAEGSSNETQNQSLDI